MFRKAYKRHKLKAEVKLSISLGYRDSLGRFCIADIEFRSVLIWKRFALY